MKSLSLINNDSREQHVLDIYLNTILTSILYNKGYEYVEEKMELSCCADRKATTTFSLSKSKIIYHYLCHLMNNDRNTILNYRG